MAAVRAHVSDVGIANAGTGNKDLDNLTSMIMEQQLNFSDEKVSSLLVAVATNCAHEYFAA